MSVHRIEICGGIASGKTTLTKLLEREAFISVLEDFQAVPFWEDFYADPMGTAFETEVSFLLQHYHQIKKTAKQIGPSVCDFSLVLDLAYAKVTLSPEKLEAFEAVLRVAQQDVPAPSLIVHLVCNPEIELERIRSRARPAEQSIDLGYLTDLNRSIAASLPRNQNILRIDSAALNFRDDPADIEKVLALVALAASH